MGSVNIEQLNQALPGGWASTTLGEVQWDKSAAIIPNKMPDTRFELYSVPSFDSDHPEIVLGQEIGSNKQIVNEDTVLLCKINPRINRVWIVGNYSPLTKIASTEWIPFDKLEGLVPEYLCYYMQMDTFRDFLSMHASGVGGSLMRIKPTTFASYPFPFAPFNEQRRIVDAIETQFTRLDAGVSGLKQIQAKLKRYRAAVLKAAVEGALTEDWRAQHPDVEPAPVLLQRILHERRAAWEQAELAKYAKAGKTPPKGWQNNYKESANLDATNLPSLPDSWRWSTVEQLLIQPASNGLSIKGSNEPPGTPALRLSAMSDTGFDYADRRYIPISETAATPLAIQAGDYFVSRGNGSIRLVGRGTLAQEPPEVIVFPDTMIRLRLSKLKPLRRFVNILWSTRWVRSQIEQKARTTAGIYKISQADIDSFTLPLPPLDEQEQIVTEVERRLSVVTEIEAQIAAELKRAERLRQAILKQAFSGQLVPQDPDDEPASALLQRIRASKNGRASTAAGPDAVQLQFA